MPLNTIAPNQGVIGLQYRAVASLGQRVGAVRAGRRASRRTTAGPGLYSPAGLRRRRPSRLGDLARPALTLRGGVLNLTDAKYFGGSNVRGRAATDPMIDRYSSPGISGLVSLASLVAGRSALADRGGAGTFALAATTSTPAASPA